MVMHLILMIMNKLYVNYTYIILFIFILKELHICDYCEKLRVNM